MGQHHNVDADLQFIFQEAGVDEQAQYNVGQHYRTVKRFSAIELVLGEPLMQISISDRIQQQIDQGLLPSCRLGTQHYHEEDIKLRQEVKGLGIPRPLPHTDRSAMKRAVEAARGEEIGEKDQPSTEDIAVLLEEIEQDKVTAHPLDEVTSRKESQALQLQSSVDQSGRVRITRQRPKGKLPVNTEALRHKLRIESNSWLMVASKMRNKPFLRNLEQRHFDRYTDYILGEKCYLMMVPGPSGEKIPLQPPWHIILDYEFEMRKKALKLAQRDMRP